MSTPKKDEEGLSTSRCEPSERGQAAHRDVVYLVVLSGNGDDALVTLEARYPERTVVHLTKEEVRADSLLEQIRRLRGLRGHAFVLFSETWDTMWEPQLKQVVALAHRCRFTVLAAGTGEYFAYRRREVIPRLVWSGAVDVMILAGAAMGWRLLKLWLLTDKRRASPDAADLDVLHLYPVSLVPLRPGGELSFLKGTISGFTAMRLRAAVVSGREVQGVETVHVVPNGRRLYLLKESQALSYNVAFVRAVRRLLGRRRPRFIYQRHGKFVASGAILSRLLRAPLVLEYQNPEFWWAKTWGASRFLRLLERIEDVVIAAASLIVVVSDVLKRDLIDKGVHPDRIIVNPAGVDPHRFGPSPERESTREHLGFSKDDVVVAFVGSFYQWHGVDVLEKAIRELAKRRKKSAAAASLRFLLVGDGPLRSDIEGRVKDGQTTELATFTGRVDSDRVPELLAAADILASPTVPMPGKPFFGSPSKLYEYMATGAAIVASDLDQLGDVLTHGETARLVRPGDDKALADAFELLAENAEMRRELGRQARAAVLERHTWQHNAERVLDALEHLERERAHFRPSSEPVSGVDLQRVTRHKEGEQFASW
jgi:glycosyltransferase involved in cell wall biosynthesis